MVVVVVLLIVPCLDCVGMVNLDADGTLVIDPPPFPSTSMRTKAAGDLVDAYL